MPKKMLIVASVMMKLCRPERTTAQPLTTPSAPPIASAAEDGERASGRPSASISQPNAMAAQTPMAPTARFSPPVTITTIIEKPIMMLIGGDTAEREQVERRQEALGQHREDDAEDEDQDQEPELVGEPEAQGPGRGGSGLARLADWRRGGSRGVSSHRAIRSGRDENRDRLQSGTGPRDCASGRSGATDCIAPSTVAYLQAR